MHIKKLSVALIAACMFILSSVGTVFANNIGVVTASSLNVRESASAYAEILAEISQGSEVVLIERVDDWYKINIGFEGYVNAAYIKTPEEIAAANSMVAPTVPSVMAEATSTTVSKGQQVVDTAKQYLGVKYVYGGSTPNGFDCSGFVQYVYRQLGVSLNRVAADQAIHGIWVAKEDLMPGDLVFFKKGSRAIHHVGIYVGDGMYIHAPQTGRTVSIDPMTRTDYYTARRIFY